jgi:8-oxo-dGTP diphosphatase
LFHLVSEIIVKHEDGMYLLMQRDWKKPNSPGLYEATAGGSALKGEVTYIVRKSN